MKLKIYQSFYLPEQLALLDKKFLPYANLENKNPELHEYPIILDLYSQNKHFDGYWGMLSWRFKEKTKISGDQFIQMICQDPSFDVYHFNPFYEEVTKFTNPFVNGEIHHPGMVAYINKLLTLMGYNMNIQEQNFDKDLFIYCSYYVGNSKFWDQWMAFLDVAMYLTKKDSELNNYAFHVLSRHRTSANINFPFIVERLVNLFLYLYQSEYKVKSFK